MPITKSAQKALRQNKRRHARNLVKKEKLHDVVKEFRTLIAQKKIAEAKKILPMVYQTLDKTAKVGLIKKNTASRKKSRLASLLNKTAAKK